LQYLWQDNSTTAQYSIIKAGNYSVSVMNEYGCKASDTIKVSVGCSGVFFPTAFTPNADGRNDTFGAIGDLGLIKNYKMVVYNRWGQLVFETTNAFDKWKGTFKKCRYDCGSVCMVCKI